MISNKHLNDPSQVLRELRINHTPEQNGKKIKRSEQK